MTERPSAIIGDHLLLDRRGAAMLAAALDAAMKLAGRDGVDFRGRSHWDDVAFLRAQAGLVAAGRTGPVAANGQQGTPWSFTPPDSDSIVSVAEAAVILGCSPRTVVRAIQAGRLPAKRAGRAHVLAELDVRMYAARDRRNVDDTEARRQGLPAGRPDTGRSIGGRERGGRDRGHSPKVKG